MTDRTLIETARATVASTLRDWAETTLRGIDQLEMRTCNRGNGHIDTALIGSWYGAWVEIRGPFQAFLVERCDTCSMFVTKTGIASCESMYALSRAVLTSPATSVTACFDCRWLEDAAAVAAQTPQTRRAQRRYARRYGATCGDVLARHNAQCRPVIAGND